jgi:hypothetical protein
MHISVVHTLFPKEHEAMKKQMLGNPNSKNQNEPRELENWQKYCDEANWHDAAKLLPLLSEDKLKELADDIREHGLLNPIVLADGKVIDGRNRILACRIAGVIPTFIELKETTLSRVEWVIRQNVIRRHLTVTQLAVVAYDALPLYEAEAKKRQQAHGGTAPGKSKDTSGKISPSDDAEGSKARTQAAKSVGVNERYVSSVRKIFETSPNLLPLMRSGGITIQQALKQVVNGGQKTKPPKESLENLREKLLEMGGIYLIKFGQVQNAEQVEAELDAVRDALWEIYENDAQRPEPDNPSSFGASDID